LDLLREQKPGRSNLRWSGLIAGLAVAFGSIAASAMPTAVDYPVQQIKGFYHHSSWTAKDGAPEGVRTMTQIPSGWLWLGGPFGIYRFDGKDFENLDLRPKNSAASRAVTNLYTTRNGDVWITYASGGAVRVNAGELSAPEEFPGLPDQPLYQIIEDGDGRMWAASRDGGYWMLENRRWHRAGPEWGLPEGVLSNLRLDDNEQLWIATRTAVAVLRKGSRRFEQFPRSGTIDLGVSEEGRLWVHDGLGFGSFEVDGVSVHRGTYVPRSQKGASILSRDGSFWTVACPRGVCRTPHLREAGQVDVNANDAYTAADGLSSDRAMTLFEDATGGIWVGTKRGLDQFRRTDFVNVQFPEPLTSFTLFPAEQSGIWVGTYMQYSNIEDSLWHLAPSATRLDGFSGPITASTTNLKDGTILGGYGHLWEFRDDKPQSFGPALPGSNLRVLNMIRDAAGSLWVYLRPQGLYKLEVNEWVKNGGIGALPNSSVESSALADDGSLLLGYADDQVVSLREDRVERLSRTEGLSVGGVYALMKDKVFLVGGELGLDAYDGSRFVALSSGRDNILTRVGGIARDATGAIWVLTDDALVRFSEVDLQAAILDPQHHLHVEVFDEADGVPGGGESAVNGLTFDRENRVWVANTQGVAWAHPANIRHHTQPPPVEILSVTTPKGDLLTTSGRTLPAGTNNVEIKYTAIELNTPARVRFRVKLEGADNDWVDRGSTRTSGYFNLGPGRFRFLVTASVYDGVWTKSPQVLEFSIAPLFYQTTTFRMVCMFAVLGLLWQIYALRVRQIMERARREQQARTEERERIARDLHDTLIQSAQGMILLFQGFASDLERTDPKRNSMEEALDHAERLLHEARDRVSNLRTGGTTTDFVATIQQLVQDASEGTTTKFNLIVSGSPRHLAVDVADELFQVVREALLNAARHAAASTLEVELVFEEDVFGLRVTDDGKGFDPSRGNPQTGELHFGIVGMRERAQRIKADFKLSSREGAGTEVTVSVPGSAAYPSHEAG
jgi:signal transduction histidine kinase/ligand-binding sensor domain-containing protein